MISLILMLSSVLSYAGQEQHVPDFCKVVKPASRPGVPTNQKAEWFFKAFPNRKMVAFSADNDNYLKDLDTQAEYEIPGKYDAIPIGDDLIVRPSYYFYLVDDLIAQAKAGQKQKAIYEDDGLGGLYPSVGITEETSTRRVFRIFTDRGSGRMREYVYDKQAKSVKPLSEVKKVCQNVDLKLPMLSKNGREIAGIDSKVGVTKIFSLESDGSCIEKENLGIIAGKVNFSPDGRKMTFHTRSDSFGGWFKSPKAEDNLNVFVYDRDTV